MYHKLAIENQSMFTKILFEKLKGSGLTQGQPKILEYLFDNDGAVQKDIAAACFIEPATVTSLLSRMENNGLITREMKKENRRFLYVYLTEKGRNEYDRIKAAFEASERTVFEGFDEEERSVCINMLRRINQNLRSVNADE